MDGRPSTLWHFSPQSSFLLANALKLWSFAHQCQIHCPSYSQSSIFSIPHPPVLCMSTNAPCCSPSGILVCGLVWARALYKHQNLFFSVIFWMNCWQTLRIAEFEKSRRTKAKSWFQYLFMQSHHSNDHLFIFKRLHRFFHALAFPWIGAHHKELII